MPNFSLYIQHHLPGSSSTASQPVTTASTDLQGQTAQHPDHAPKADGYLWKPLPGSVSHTMLHPGISVTTRSGESMK